MPALADGYARLPHEARRAPAQRERTLGQRAQRIERGNGARQPAQGRNEILQLVEQLLVQPLFPRQCPFLRRQGLVFKRLEFGRDVALGIFQRLAAAVVGGHLVELALRDLDVKTMHLVELHTQVGNAGAGFFAAFELQQKTVAIGLDGAQLVEFGVTAVVDDAAVANQRGRFI